MLTHGTVTAVDSLILFQMAGTNFVLNCTGVIAYSLQFSKVATATANMTDSSRYKYDWWRRLSHVNMTDFDLTKYDWRWRLCGGGSGDYTVTQNKYPTNQSSTG